MIYVFRRAASDSANLLAEALDGVRIRRPENLIRRVRPTDKVVMWGEHLPEIRGMVLNNTPLQSKFDDAIRLKDAGVATIEARRGRPSLEAQPVPVDPMLAIWDEATDMSEAFANLLPTRAPTARAGILEFHRKLVQLHTALEQPAPVAPPPRPVGEWLGRSNQHVGGADLLHPTGHADFWVKKEALVNEYRVHSFLGRSIRAGRKILREGFFVPGTTHPHGPQYV